jgi:hypothetical protein
MKMPKWKNASVENKLLVVRSVTFITATGVAVYKQR